MDRLFACITGAFVWLQVPNLKHLLTLAGNRTEFVSIQTPYRFVFMVVEN
jgi:hypothetical protein